jgi:hypothetical protein
MDTEREERPVEPEAPETPIPAPFQEEIVELEEAIEHSEVPQKRSPYYQGERIEEASGEQLKKVEAKVIGRRLKATKLQVRKAYALIDTLLPESIRDVEKILKAEMGHKQKRDGWLVLSIAKFLSSKRLPDVGKIEAEKDGIEVELTLPKKTKPNSSNVSLEAGVEPQTRGQFLRMKSDRPIDLKIRQSTEDGKGKVVEDLQDSQEMTLLGVDEYV